MSFDIFTFGNLDIDEKRCTVCPFIHPSALKALNAPITYFNNILGTFPWVLGKIENVIEKTPNKNFILAWMSLCEKNRKGSKRVKRVTLCMIKIKLKCFWMKKAYHNQVKSFFKRLPGVGTEPRFSRFHLFSYFSPLYRWATAAPQGQKLFYKVAVTDRLAGRHPERQHPPTYLHIHIWAGKNFLWINFLPFHSLQTFIFSLLLLLGAYFMVNKLLG
jgi:hypothetical protein